MQGNCYGLFADIYDRLMDDVNYDAWYADIKSLLSPFAAAPPARVCDVACGTGQFALRFAREGYEVTGIDISTDMLRIAEQNSRKQGVKVRFSQQDMRNLALPRPVPIITCACDGVNYLTTPADVCAFFAAVKKSLAPNGAFVFDVSTEQKLRQQLGNNSLWDLRDDAAYIWQNRFNEEKRLVVMDLTFFSREADGRYVRFEERHVQRAHSHDEIIGWLAREGFAVEGILKTSMRAHYVCKHKLGGSEMNG